MINLARFALARELVTVERFRGVYVDGIFTRVLQDTFTMSASVQPYRTVEEDIVFEVPAGEWIDNIRIMYSNLPVYPNDNNQRNRSEHPVADIVYVKGRKYRPVKSEEWLHLSLPHYRTILRIWDGD